MKAAHESSQIEWSDLKPMIRKRWLKITEDDLRHLNGNADELVNILRKRYGYGKTQAEIEIRKWLVEQNIQPNT